LPTHSLDLRLLGNFDVSELAAKVDARYGLLDPIKVVAVLLECAKGYAHRLAFYVLFQRAPSANHLS